MPCQPVEREDHPPRGIDCMLEKEVKFVFSEVNPLSLCKPPRGSVRLLTLKGYKVMDNVNICRRIYDDDDDDDGNIDRK